MRRVLSPRHATHFEPRRQSQTISDLVNEEREWTANSRRLWAGLLALEEVIEDSLERKMV